MIRLELALQAAQKVAQGRPILVLLHYPPLYQQERDTPFTRLLEKYGVHTVVYGHLHGQGIRAVYAGFLRQPEICFGRGRNPGKQILRKSNIYLKHFR